jgi:hypothetical protein
VPASTRTHEAILGEERVVNLEAIATAATMLALYAAFGGLPPWP